MCFNIWYLFFSFWLTSLSAVLSGSLYISANGAIPFLFLSDIPWHVCTTSSLSIQTWLSTHAPQLLPLVHTPDFSNHYCDWSVIINMEARSWVRKKMETHWRPLDSKEIQPVHPEGDQSWVFTGRTDAEAKAPILWPPRVKSWLIGKDPDAGRDWGQEEKGPTEGEMAGWHHWLDGHESE